MEKSVFLDIDKIIYFEAVERKCFIYTESEVYESDYKLYELEEQLEEYGFFRVSKACLVCLHSIRYYVFGWEKERKAYPVCSNWGQKDFL